MEAFARSGRLAQVTGSDRGPTGRNRMAVAGECLVLLAIAPDTFYPVLFLPTG